VTDGIDAVDTPHARTSRVFMIDGSDATVVVDAGRGLGDLRGYLGLDTATRLVLTRSHWDHVGNAHQFDDVSTDERERNPDGSLTLDVVSEVFLKRPGQFVANHLEQGRPLPESVDPDTFDVPPVPAADTHADGDREAVRIETNWRPADEYEIGESTVLVSPAE
jgi:glyoxylase-like metal-dependent hydrolase (beta-lactamase superfamily II)